MTHYRSLIFIVLLWLSPLLAASTGQNDAPSPYSFPSYFESDPVPEDITPSGNPLDWAGAKIGLDVRNFTLPRAYENDYRFVCRFPIIDYVSNRPLYMKQWVEDTYNSIVEHHNWGLDAVEQAIDILTSDPQYHLEAPTVDEEAVDQLSRALGSSAHPELNQRQARALFAAYTQSAQMVQSALADLTAEDRAYFEKNPVAFLLPDGEKMADLTGNTDAQLEYISHLRRVKIDLIMEAARHLNNAILDFYKSERRGERRFLTNDEKLCGRVEVNTAWGKVIIAGEEDDIHNADTDFLIDFGGNDTYTNNAGGAVNGVAVCIDISGDDRYDSSERRFTQGCGALGVGILFDIKGNDTYTAHHFAQGAGIAGVGLLYDKIGTDSYSGQGFTQGAAMFGLGMLMDDAGDDSYDCATISQGGATTMGLGILFDAGGNDRYKLGADTGKDAFGGLPGYGQGGALSFRPSPWRGKFTPYGGVGMLLDAGGDDDYMTTGWCDQGGSYIMSLGVLYDYAGNDHYKAGTGQGSGIHITNAILIDRRGNDHYEGGFRTGGSGGDRSPGFLLDYEGNDTYKSGSSSYGTGCKPNSYSLMIDYKGDDTYITDNPKGPILFNCWDSFGGVWPESAPNLYPYAICLDLGGNDDYQVRNRRNNSVRHSFGHGIQLDMEWKGEDVVGKVENPLDDYNKYRFPIKRYGAQKPIRATGIYDPNLFVRFNAIGTLAQQPEEVIAALTDTTFRSNNRQSNRDLLECLHYSLIEKRLPPQLEPQLAAILHHTDPEVRLIIADDIGVFGITSCEIALLETLDDPEPQVRRFAYRSLMSLKSDKGLKKARLAVKKDESEDVRRLALAYLTTIESKGRLYKLLIDRLNSDPGSSVKVLAADALGRMGNHKAVKSLRKQGQTCDVYVQRAVAKALCEMNDMEGIGMLIESLSFPSIDAFFNYDYNVPNFISTYSGYDFPDPDRYDQARWREWFAANKGQIKLTENIAASRAYASLLNSLRGVSDEELITSLEDFLHLYPQHRNAAGTLAAQLNRIAWDMATAPRDNPRFNPAQAIIYSQRSCELVPDPNYWDTYAEALFAAGRFDESVKVCEDQLALSPGNRMFLDRLEKIKQMK